MTAVHDHQTSDELAPDDLDAPERTDALAIVPPVVEAHAGLAQILRAFVHPCTSCRTEMLSRPGLCEACEGIQRHERRRIGLVRAFRRSLPETYREYPGFDDALRLAGRVRDPSGVARARASCRATSWCTTIRGPAAAGKTHVALAMAAALVYASCSPGEYVAASDLALARSRSRLGSEPEIVRTALEAGVLVVDDLDLAVAAHGSAVVDVIHARHRHHRLTIVTTSMTPAETAERHGDGTARRLYERDVATVLELRPVTGAR